MQYYKVHPPSFGRWKHKVEKDLLLDLFSAIPGFETMLAKIRNYNGNERAIAQMWVST